ncbi:MAG TPA: DUF1343 domain-containing protein [Gemmatimonadales bacterium]|nr:DUF1343 domain-containing protein [Gemmatimonadales bacterium]
MDRCLMVSVLVLSVVTRPLAAQVRVGIDVLLSDSMHLVRGQRVRLLTNQTGVDRHGHPDLERLEAAGVRVIGLYSPEHGFQGALDRPDIPNSIDRTSGLPIYSLYGGTHPPLDSTDAVLIDLQDVGARYYTYVATASLLMTAAARARVPVIVLDRPNPLGGSIVQGNVAERPRPASDLPGVLPVAMRHGMTLGEMLRMANDLYALHANLTVVPAAGWRRDMSADETGLAWITPSPALPTLESARHYPGLCLFEGTNLSVGRGTALAFQMVGAPWLDAHALIAHMAGAPGLQGVALSADTVTPSEPPDGKYAGRALRVVRLRVTDQATYDPTHAAVALLAALLAAYPDSFQFKVVRFDRLADGPALRDALLAHQAPDAIWKDWASALAAFARVRLKYLLY